MLPSGPFDNLLVAGRAIDADTGAFGALRVMVNCNQTGEAAGIAASIAADTNCAVASVDTAALRHCLADSGAIII